MLDLRRLRLLRELHNRGTIGAVADALAFTPSAVSQQLAQLQRETGVVLIEKSGRRLRLTGAALQLVNHTEVILTELERAEADLARSSENIEGSLRVATFPTAAINLMPSAIRAAAVDAPMMTIEMVELELSVGMSELLVGSVDMILGNEYDYFPQEALPGVFRQEIMYDELELALPAGHPLADAPVIELNRLAGESWAAGSSGTGFGETVTRVCVSLGGFDPRITYRSDDFGVIQSLVANGLAVALLPRLGGLRADDAVVFRTVGDGRLGRKIFLATRRGAQDNPLIQAFGAAIQGAVRNLTKPGSRAAPPLR